MNYTVVRVFHATELQRSTKVGEPFSPSSAQRARMLLQAGLIRAGQPLAPVGRRPQGRGMLSLHGRKALSGASSNKDAAHQRSVK